MNSASLADFLRELATLLDAGVPIVRSLESMSRRGHRKLRRVSCDLALSISRGASLGEAIAEHHTIFDPVSIATIEAAERSGRLPTTLQRMSDALMQGRNLRRQVWIGLLYPLLVFHVGVVIIAIMKTFIRMTPQGAQTGPFWIEGAKALFIGFGPAYLVVAGVWAFFRIARVNAGVRAIRDTIMRLIPIVGRLWYHLSIARLARNLEGLYTAGIGLPRCLELTAKATDHEPIRQAVVRVAEAVANGGDPQEAFAAAGAFPVDFIAMVQTGLESGRLDEMLTKIAEKHEDDAKAKAKVLSVMLPLLVMLLVGAFLVYFIITTFVGGYLQQINDLLGD